MKPPPRSTLFPYTTLFRSVAMIEGGELRVDLLEFLEIAKATGFDPALAIRELTKTRSEEHTSELQSQFHLVCRLLLEKKKRIHVLLLSIAVSPVGFFSIMF